jgi:hypothetical protein
MLTQSRLKEILCYSQETGEFVWIKSPCKRIANGSIAGMVDKDGYIIIGIDYRIYRAHRLVFLYLYGEMPIEGIDHENRNKADNRKSNLRIASNSVNQRNTKLPKNNTSGHIGVSFSRGRGKYSAYGMLERKKYNLGTFSKIEDAVLARKEWNKIHCHRNHGEQI